MYCVSLTPRTMPSFAFQRPLRTITFFPRSPAAASPPGPSRRLEPKPGREGAVGAAATPPASPPAPPSREVTSIA